jgi:hypothetical protein
MQPLAMAFFSKDRIAPVEQSRIHMPLSAIIGNNLGIVATDRLP